MLSLLGGIAGALGSLFGDKKKESFNRTSDTTTTASSQDLGPTLLRNLESLFNSQLRKGGFQHSAAALDTRLGQLLEQSKRPEFDVSGFASGIARQATAGAQLDLESQIGGMLSKLGATESGNSAGALLANKIRNNTAANLAGIISQATAQGEQIRQSGQQMLNEGFTSIGGTLANEILNLIQVTRGARNTGTSNTKEVSMGSGNAKASGNPFSGFGDFFSELANARTNA